MARTRARVIYSPITTHVTLNPHIREHPGDSRRRYLNTTPSPAVVLTVSHSVCDTAKMSNCGAGACDCLRHSRRRYAMKLRLSLPPHRILSHFVVYFSNGPPGFPAFLPPVGRGEEEEEEAREDGYNNLYAWRVYTCGCTGKPVRLTISHTCMRAFSSPSPRLHAPL